ncbi:MAG TPA: alpha/beta fold hydrolase [Allosphingosinicella sp.]|nr:alpha/beta fold hydrolase [Allosphingosinicella sp.]
MWPWALLLSPLLAYSLILAFVYFAQTRLLFPAGSVLSAGPMPRHWRPLTLHAETGHRLHGVHVPPQAQGGDPLLILGFGGNAWNAESAAAFLHDLFPRADVVVFHYRGYAPSEGSPSAAALQADALAIHDLARQLFSDHRIVVVGFSVGSGVASYLAAHRPVDGLILVTPFDSLAEVASDQYPWLPVRSLLRHRMEPARDLGETKVPVALIAAGADRLVRPIRAEALSGAVHNLVFYRTLAGASHNDIYDRQDFRATMQRALEQLSADR